MIEFTDEARVGFDQIAEHLAWRRVGIAVGRVGQLRFHHDVADAVFVEQGDDVCGRVDELLIVVFFASGPGIEQFAGPQRDDAIARGLIVVQIEDELPVTHGVDQYDISVGLVGQKSRR